MNIPNALTMLRILLIPALVLVVYWPFKWHFYVATLIFIVAAITDWLDGYLARRLDQGTPFGAFLDPVADKLMVAVALVLLVELHASPWFAVPACIIISREILVSALREWMADLGKRTSVAVSYIGKVKTTLQMIAIGVFLAAEQDVVPWLAYIGYVLLYAAALLTVWSMFVYLRAAAPELRLEK